MAPRQSDKVVGTRPFSLRSLALLCTLWFISAGIAAASEEEVAVSVDGLGNVAPTPVVDPVDPAADTARPPAPEESPPGPAVAGSPPSDPSTPLSPATEGGGKSASAPAAEGAAPAALAEPAAAGRAPGTAGDPIGETECRNPESAGCGRAGGSVGRDGDGRDTRAGAPPGADVAQEERLRPLKMLLLAGAGAFAVYLTFTVGGTALAGLGFVFGSSGVGKRTGALSVAGSYTLTAKTKVFVLECGGQRFVVTETTGEGVHASVVPLQDPAPAALSRTQGSQLPQCPQEGTAAPAAAQAGDAPSASA